MDKLEEIKNKISAFQAKSAAKDEIQAFITLAVGVLKKYKDTFDSISSENLSQVREIITDLETKRGEILLDVDSKTTRATKDFDKKLKEVRDLLNEIKSIEVRDGVDGKDADEEKIISEVLSKIPPVPEVVLDDGIEIVDKINGSDVKIKEDKLDLTGIEKSIKDIGNIAKLNSVPATTSFINGKRAKNINFSGASVAHSGDTATVTITGGVGGGHTIQDEGTPLTQRTNLNFVGTGVAVTDDSGNDATVVTISSGGGSGDVTKVGTPVNNQIGVWTGDGTIEGDVDLTFDGATNTLGVGLVGLDGRVQVHAVKSDASDGLLIEASNGTDVGLLGVGNTANVTWHGAHNFDTATQDTVAAFTGSGKTLGSLALATYPSLTELSYVKGVTSAIQTQLNGKLASSDYDDATAGETTTGTSTTKYVSPDGLAGSDYGKRVVGILVSDPLGSAITTGDGKAYFRVPSVMNGWNLVAVAMSNSTFSSSGIPTVQLRRSRRTNATTRSDADMLSTKLTVDAGEYDSSDAATAAVIDTSNDDVVTGDYIFIDQDVAGTGVKGEFVELIFQLP